MFLKTENNPEENVKAGSPEPILEIRVLGAGEIATAPGGTAFTLGAKAVGLLGALAMRSPRYVSRDELAGMFWPEVTEGRSKNSLRQEIRRIKKAIGEEQFARCVDLKDQGMALRQGSFTCDARELEAVASQSVVSGLRALELYQGDFLAASSIRSEKFQDWVSVQREYFRDLAVRSLCELARSDIANTDIWRAQKAAAKAVTIDPLSEPAHEQMIRCYLISGGRAQAKANYELFRNRMRDELGVEPEFTFEQLAASAGSERRLEAMRPVLAIVREDDGIPDSVVSEIAQVLSKSPWLGGDALVYGDEDQATHVMRLYIRHHQDRWAISMTISRRSDNMMIASDVSEGPVSEEKAVYQKVAARLCGDL